MTAYIPVLAVISVATNGINYRVDGGVPTSSIGHPVAAPNELHVCGVLAIQQWQGIRSGSADATITVTYYKALGT